MNKRESCKCGCKVLITQLLEGQREQSRLLAAQNDVMGKIIDQNTELMAHLISDADDEVDPNKSLD